MVSDAGIVQVARELVRGAFLFAFWWNFPNVLGVFGRMVIFFVSRRSPVLIDLSEKDPN